MIDRKVLIIGAGFAGLAAAIELTKAGHRDVTVLERADELGGTWQANTYPGAACDVPAPLYTYSFAPNPDYAERFPGQAEILAYMKDTARRFGVDSLIRFGVEVTELEFDAARACWRVHTSTGEVIDADVVVPCVGQLSRPSIPPIEGVDRFAGPSFHSAEWDHTVNLAGKRIAVIGTGASAIQLIPELQTTAAHVIVFQRTAPWIIPRPQRLFSTAHRWLFRHVPVALQAERAVFWAVSEALQKSMTSRHKIVVHGFALVSKALLHYKVRDPQLRAKLTPREQAGCKRILFDPGYLDALNQPNVELVNEAIVEITADGVRTGTGLREADVVVWGTGFAATELLAPMKIRGLDGRSLDDVWAEGAHAYYGMAVPGFPNLFIMYGPNTSLGSGSIIAMLEPQARYIAQAATHLQHAGPGSYVEVRADTETAYDEEVQRRIAGSVWTTCSSWYRNAAGRVVANWPGSTREYARRIARFESSAYETRVAS